MSSAFVREGGDAPQIFSSRDSAESAAKLNASMDGERFTYEVRSRGRGGFMVARLDRDGNFDSWVSE
jgi:hypothetical protein